MLGRPADDDSRHQSREDREKHLEMRGQHVVGQEGRSRSGQEGRGVDPLVEGSHEVFLGGIFLGVDHENSHEGEDDPYSGNGKWKEDRAHLFGRGDGTALRGEGRRAQSGRGQDRTAVGLVKVRAHPSDVSDVVTDVVRDDSRVPGIVLGNSGFGLAHQIGSHVRRLGEDTAAHAGEQGLGACAHPEGQHDGRDFLEVLDSEHAPLEVGGVFYPVQDLPPDRDVEQAQSDDHETHDRAASEGDLQTLVQGFGRPRGRTTAGVGRGFHSEIAGKTAEEAPGEEGDRCPWALDPQDEGEEGEEGECEDEEHPYDPVLGKEIGHGALTHVPRDLLGPGSSRIGLHEVRIEYVGKNQGQDRSDRGNPEKQRYVHRTSFKLPPRSGNRQGAEKRLTNRSIILFTPGRVKQEFPKPKSRSPPVVHNRLVIIASRETLF